MLKILQARLQWYVNFQMFKLDLEKAEELEIKLPTSIGSSKKAREFQKNIYFCFTDYAKAFDCVQFISVAQLCPTLCNSMNHSQPGLPVHHQPPEFTQTHVQWIGDAIQPSHPLSFPFLLPSIFLNIRVFSNESALHIRGPKYWNFSFNISPSSEYSGLISFRKITTNCGTFLKRWEYQTTWPD